MIKVIKAYKSQSRHYLITELCNSGDLSTLMDVRRHLSEEESRIILKQIVVGLRDINKGKVIHRDMKLANILLHFPNEDLLALKKDERKVFLKNVNLVETPFEIKISDFGFAKAKNLPGENRVLSICGTPAYMAPDLVVGKDTHYKDKFDIWALGAIFCELLVGIPPFIERTIE